MVGFSAASHISSPNLVTIVTCTIGVEKEGLPCAVLLKNLHPVMEAKGGSPNSGM